MNKPLGVAIVAACVLFASSPGSADFTLENSNVATESTGYTTASATITAEREEIEVPVLDQKELGTGVVNENRNPTAEIANIEDAGIAFFEADTVAIHGTATASVSGDMTLSHTQENGSMITSRTSGRVTASAYGNIPFLFEGFSFIGSQNFEGILQGGSDLDGILSDDSISTPSQDGDEDRLVISAANARLFAAAGNGDVTAPEFATQGGGFIVAEGDAISRNLGIFEEAEDENGLHGALGALGVDASAKATETTPAVATVSGEASVDYQFEGNSETENASVSNTEVDTRTNSPEQDSVGLLGGTARGWVQALAGWEEDSPFVGGQAGVNSEARRTGFVYFGNIYSLEEGEATEPETVTVETSAQGNSSLAFSIRPAGAPVEIEASAGGSTGASTGLDFAIIFGRLEAQSGLNAVAVASTRAAESDRAMAFQDATIGALGLGILGGANAWAESPAQLDPDTGVPSGASASSTSPSGTYSAGLVPDSLSNTRVESSGEFGLFRELNIGASLDVSTPEALVIGAFVGEAYSTSYALAVSQGPDRDLSLEVGDDPEGGTGDNSELFDLGDEGGNMVSYGSLTAADTTSGVTIIRIGRPGSVPTPSANGSLLPISLINLNAQNSNIYGNAQSDSGGTLVENGASDSSIGPPEDDPTGPVTRTANASADSIEVTGPSPFYTMLGRQQYDGSYQTEGLPFFFSPGGGIFDHLSFGGMAAGSE